MHNLVRSNLIIIVFAFIGQVHSQISALGARGIDILMQFLIEAIIISITVGLIGVALGITATKLVTIFLKWPTMITQSSVLLSFLVCFITGVFFGYYPAAKASRLDPIEALRYE